MRIKHILAVAITAVFGGMGASFAAVTSQDYVDTALLLKQDKVSIENGSPSEGQVVTGIELDEKGSKITVSKGAPVTNASESTAGIVKVGENISVDNGTISVPLANTATFGVVKAGDNITIADGVISAAAVTVDSALNADSTNPVENKAVDAAIKAVQTAVDAKVASVSATGTGNVVTEVSTAGGAVTLTKGLTAITGVSGTVTSGQVVTGLSVSQDKIAFTTGDVQIPVKGGGYASIYVE